MKQNQGNYKLTKADFPSGRKAWIGKSSTGEYLIFKAQDVYLAVKLFGFSNIGNPVSIAKNPLSALMKTD